GRKVALKLLSPQLSEDASFRERFTRESRLAASLDHPNIIPIYEAAESDGVFFIAMRYVDGADLRKLMQEGPIDPRRLVPIIDETANALTAAHARGLVHRDVKPANILIDRGAGRGDADHVYLSDFGVAKQIAAPALTTTGTFVGTVDYASPEQIEGKTLDGRADVYSLGCVVYECLTGSSAYDKDSEVALMYAHLLEPPPHVTEKRPDLPAAIDEVVAKSMAKSKEDRYETPKQLAAALSQVLGQLDVPTPAPGPDAPATVLVSGLATTAAGTTTPSATAAPTQADAPSAVADASGAPATTAAGGTPPARPPQSRKPLLIGAALVAGIAAIVGVTVLVMSVTGDDDKQATATTQPDTGTGSTTTAVPAGSLLDVVAPSEIASACAKSRVPAKDAVETNVCTTPDNAPAARPDEFELSFFKDAKSLQAAYTAAQSGLQPARCGDAEGERVWIHTSTGKTGGHRACFIDLKSRFVILWTHEKLGSEDHVDTLGIAREPGRAPTAFAGWWSSVNDFLGKCRQQVALHTCLATIRAITGKS
ncbi:MAG: protein kinase domain-containing protein, partial [Gaiellaceae bacterium]